MTGPQKFLFVSSFAVMLAASSAQARFLQTDPIGYDDQTNLYAYVGNDPVNQTDSTGLCPSCFWGFAVELGFQAYTGDFRTAVSSAVQGNFSPLGISAAKLGIATLTGGANSILTSKAVGVVGSTFQAAGISKAETALAKVQVMGVVQAASGAANKAATNAVEGKPITKDVGTAATVAATVGTGGSRLTGGLAAAAPVVASNSGAAVSAIGQAVTGVAKKEGTCNLSNGRIC